MRISLLLIALIGVLTPKLTCAAETTIRYEASHDAMGTSFTVVCYGRDRDYLAEVVNEVFEEIDGLDAQMSNYRPESELSRINREAARQSVVVEPRLFQLVRDAVRTSEETGGAFDITVGPLMKSWGFFRGRGRLPSRKELAQVLKRVGYWHITLEAAPRTVRFEEEGIELDLGGLGKGYAVDQAVEILRANGITSALVSSGTSSIYALGAPPAQRGWKVTVRDPFDAIKVGDVIYLKNCSLSTSGNYEKFFKLGGRIYSHIMNPKTGLPVENMLSTTVLAPRATAGDALSTAFYVLGVEGSKKYLARHPNLAAVFYLPATGRGHFKRVVLCSPSYQSAPDTLAEIESR